MLCQKLSLSGVPFLIRPGFISPTRSLSPPTSQTLLATQSPPVIVYKPSSLVYPRLNISKSLPASLSGLLLFWSIFCLGFLFFHLFSHPLISLSIHPFQDSSFDFNSNLLKLDRPLKPIWFSPAHPIDLSSRYSPVQLALLDHYPLICLCPSQPQSPNHPQSHPNFEYIQGAGDDHQSWSLNLNPETFWANQAAILSATPDQLPHLINSIVSSSPGRQSLENGLYSSYQVRHTGLELCLAGPDHPLDSSIPVDQSTLHVVISAHHQSVEIISLDYHKLVSLKGNQTNLKNLSDSLAQVVPSCLEALDRAKKVRIVAWGSSVVESHDFLVAVGLCILAQGFDDNARRRCSPVQLLDKSTIRSRLHWMLEGSEGRLNPSRSILKRVNNHLILHHQATVS